MSIQDKRNLGIALTRLSPESLSKALEIVARKNLSIQATSTEIDLDINAQSEATLWRLRIFVKDALEAQGKSSGMEVSHTTNIQNATSRPITNSKTNANMTTTNDPKRKIDSCNAPPKTAKKNKKHPS